MRDKDGYKIVKLSELDMVSVDGFRSRFFQHAGSTDTYIEAYEKAEAEYERIFGHRRYANYNSFRNSINNK